MGAGAFFGGLGQVDVAADHIEEVAGGGELADPAVEGVGDVEVGLPAFAATATDSGVTAPGPVAVFEPLKQRFVGAGSPSESAPPDRSSAAPGSSRRPPPSPRRARSALRRRSGRCGSWRGRRRRGRRLTGQPPCRAEGRPSPGPSRRRRPCSPPPGARAASASAEASASAASAPLRPALRPAFISLALPALSARRAAARRRLPHP